MNSKNIEKRYDLIRMLLAIALAMGLVLLLIVLVSSKPLEAMGYFLTGPLKNTRRFFNVIEAAIPLVFTGLAVSMLFSANMSNMSTVGAFYMACAASSYCAVVLHLPAFWHVVVCLLVGTVTGAIIASIPGVLRVKWDANELVSSLMLNYVCLYMANYIIRVKIGDTSLGIMTSKKFQATAKLPVIIPGSRIHLGLVFALILVIVCFLLMYRSKLGYAIRMTGKNSAFARYVGTSVSGTILISQLLGGAIAGLGGATEMLGIYSRFQYQGQPGYGFDGLIIAILAGYNPALVPVAALFLAYINTGADIMNRMSDVPSEIVSIMQTIIVVLVVAKMFLNNMKHKAIVRNAQKNLGE